MKIGRISSVYDVIISPVVSEKASLAEANNNQYTFKVAMSATKKQIRFSVEKIFGVKVLSVRTLTNKPEIKRSFRGIARSSGFKKAMITVPAGSSLNLQKTL